MNSGPHRTKRAEPKLSTLTDIYRLEAAAAAAVMLPVLRLATRESMIVKCRMFNCSHPDWNPGFVFVVHYLSSPWTSLILPS
jgi:hypothetical protein